MDLAYRLESLLTVAEEAGIDVRTEYMGGEGGGLCMLKGKKVLFVDISADLATRYDRTVAALAGLEELDARFIVPEVRSDLDDYRHKNLQG